ncbi:hypothetical protein CesoFtcFv8_026273 [Champsocephalus esox]|uniref:Uncharacterized protein n=1 Tax=Champsocephalus esox TaxID=159716 RepID=A0AAN8B1Z9_9TELE|nr:hypothetical protein CesoFtcFv8_026273 [Champsocephalus esox]
MQPLIRLAVYCISLLSLQQLLALSAEESPDSNRLDIINKLMGLTEDNSRPSRSLTHNDVPSSAPKQAPKWLPGFLRLRPAAGVRTFPPSLAWARPRDESAKSSRVRRRAHSGPRSSRHYPQNAQLMRVGCVLGTCQVQNLSHRLYQLIGQSGREDSSPINPRSPHSYG